MLKIRNFKFAGLLATAFFFFAFFSLLPQQIRWAGMFGVIGLCSLVSMTNFSFFLKQRFIIYLVIIITLLISVYFHNSFHPAFSEYAFNKRNYFFFIFVSCGVILPFFIAQKNYAEQMAHHLILFSFVMSLFAFVEGSGSNLRVRGLDLNPVLHSKLVFFAGLYFLALKVSPFKAPILSALMVLGFIACLITGSRGSLATFFIIAFLLYAVEMKPSKIMQGIIIFIISAFAFYLALPYLPTEIIDRFNIDTLFESQRSEGNRIFLYELSIEIIRDNLGGIGIGNMSNYFWINAPHNIFLEIIMDIGLILSAPFIFLIFWALKRSISAVRSPYVIHRFFALFYWFSLINSLIGGEISLPSSILYLPMGYLIVGYQPNKIKHLNRTMQQPNNIASQRYAYR